MLLYKHVLKTLDTELKNAERGAPHIDEELRAARRSLELVDKQLSERNARFTENVVMAAFTAVLSIAAFMVYFFSGVLEHSPFARFLFALGLFIPILFFCILAIRSYLSYLARKILRSRKHALSYYVTAINEPLHFVG
jgi:hypothetical protein